jgi:hypothetical protein
MVSKLGPLRAVRQDLPRALDVVVGGCLPVQQDVLPFYKNISQKGFGATLLMSFLLMYLFKIPISKYSQTLRYWG